MYSVLVKLPDGCFLSVTTHDELHEAVQFATELNANWPQKYVVRDSQGNAVHLIDQSGDAAQGLHYWSNLLHPTQAKRRILLIYQVRIGNQRACELGVRLLIPVTL